VEVVLEGEAEDEGEDEGEGEAEEGQQPLRLARVLS